MARPIGFSCKKSRGFRGNHHIRTCSGYSKFASQDATSILAYDYSLESTDTYSDECGGDSSTLVEGPFSSWELFQWRHPYGLDLKEQYCRTDLYKLNRTERRFIKSKVGCIVHESSDGFITARWFEDSSELERIWKLLEKDYYLDEEPDEPEEGDVTTEDFRSFYQYGKLWLSLSEEESGKWKEFVNQKMDKEKFWPNCWSISDHGNYFLHNLTVD